MKNMLSNTTQHTQQTQKTVQIKTSKQEKKSEPLPQIFFNPEIFYTQSQKNFRDKHKVILVVNQKN